MPKVEFKRKALLSRQEVAQRLLDWGNALAAGSEVELESGGDSLKIGVGDQIEWELEIEIDGDETEVEIELKWRDRPARSGGTTPAAAETPPAGTPDADTPGTETPDAGTPTGGTEPEPESAAEPTPEPARPPARRGRPRKTPAS